MRSAEAERRRQERQAEMWEYISARPHVPIVMSEMAEALGRSPGRQFGMDLRAVRDLAHANGQQITHCTWVAEVRCWAFYFLTEGDERTLAQRPIATQEAHVRTRVVHLSEAAQWAELNSERDEDRALSRLIARLTRDAANSLSAVAEFREAIETTRSRQESEDARSVE